MHLSRFTKIAVIGTALLAVGLAGRAAADTTPSSPQPAVAKSAPKSQPASQQPDVAPSRAVEHGSTTTKLAAAGPPGDSAGYAAAPASQRGSGPAGSLMTTGTRSVALTFDDGPDPIQTPKILKLLASQHVHATFCLIGSNVAAHPDLVQQIVAGGNTLCNHTWNHSLKIGKQSPAVIRADLQRTKTAIEHAALGAKVKYFRAPGGNFTPALVQVAKQLGMTSIYWGVDPRDWDHPAGETHAAHRARVIRIVENQTRAGSIVLSHDSGQPDTIVAYQTLIPWLRDRYHLIALP